MNRYRRTLLVVLTVLALSSCIRAPYPREMVLQHLPTVVAIVALALLPRRVKISDTAFTCLVAFLALHVLGARYLYSNVPYDRWSEATFGFNVTRHFHLRRNHYDRVVHLFFGLLWVQPVAEVARRHFRVPERFARYQAIEFVMAASMLYEIFEWSLTMLLSPQDAGAYNGEQGDPWDAQKDMALALAGALLATFALLAADRWHRRQEQIAPESSL